MSPIVGKMSRMILACSTAVLSVGCTHDGANAPQSQTTEQHKKGLAMAAKASSLSIKQDKSDEAIEAWKAALKEEPENREWLDGLAFTYYHAKRIKDAQPIWKKLAAGKDDIGKRATKMLKKEADVSAAVK